MWYCFDALIKTFSLRPWGSCMLSVVRKYRRWEVRAYRLQWCGSFYKIPFHQASIQDLPLDIPAILTPQSTVIKPGAQTCLFALWAEFEMGPPRQSSHLPGLLCLLLVLSAWWLEIRLWTHQREVLSISMGVELDEKTVASVHSFLSVKVLYQWQLPFSLCCAILGIHYCSQWQTSSKMVCFFLEVLIFSSDI